MSSTMLRALWLAGGFCGLAASGDCQGEGGRACARPAEVDVDDAGLLQLHSAKHATRSLTSPEGFPINFDRFIGGACPSQSVGCLRIEVPAVVGGVEYNFLMDSGSSTLALCPSDEVTNLKPALTTEGQLGACMAYGSSRCGNHGFVGDAFTSSLKVGSLGPVTGNDNLVVMMTQAKGETGNACGKPQAGSMGAVQLQGIFGFGLLNNAYCEPIPQGFKDFWTPEEMQGGGCLSCPSTCGKPGNPPWASLLKAQGPGRMQWGLSWAGAVGPGSGSLFAGDAAVAMFDTLTDKRTTSVFKMTIDEGGHYSMGIKQYQATLPNGTKTDPVPCTGPENVFDTGSSMVTFPKAILEAAQASLSESPLSAVSLTIDIEPAPGFPAEPLTLVFSGGSDAGTMLDRRNLQSSDTCLVGLAIMLWYEAVFVDIDAGTIAFAKRSAPLAPLRGD